MCLYTMIPQLKSQTLQPAISMSLDLSVNCIINPGSVFSLLTDPKLGCPGHRLLLRSTVSRRRAAILTSCYSPAFTSCSWTRCFPSHAPRSRKRTFYLTPVEYIWRSIKTALTKPVSPRACLLFLDITNGGWGWSGHALLCVIDEVLMSPLSHRVGHVSRPRFRETACTCTIMMNECLVC